MKPTYQTGNEWIKRMYCQYYSMAKLIAFRLTEDEGAADDIAAEAFISLWKGADQIQSDDHARHFLIKAVRHKWINYQRRMEKQRIIPESYAQGIESAVVQSFELLDYMRQISNQLSPKLKIVFQLHCMQNYSYKEIAEMLSISTESAKKRCSRAYSKIRELLNVTQPTSPANQ